MTNTLQLPTTGDVKGKALDIFSCRLRRQLKFFVATQKHRDHCNETTRNRLSADNYLPARFTCPGLRQERRKEFRARRAIRSESTVGSGGAGICACRSQ